MVAQSLTAHRALDAVFVKISDDAINHPYHRVVLLWIWLFSSMETTTAWAGASRSRRCVRL